MQFIAKGNAILCLNDQITKEYIDCMRSDFKNENDEIRVLLSQILSNKEYTKNVPYSMSYNMRDDFRRTSLENKIMYLEVAYYLKTRIILST